MLYYIKTRLINFVALAAFCAALYANDLYGAL